MHRLCHDLNTVFGEGTAYVPTDQTRAGYSTPHILGYPGRWQDMIFVVPEIMHSLSEKPACFVRYVLNVPGLLAGPSEYGPEEMVFAYNAPLLPFASIACGEKLGADRVFTVPAIDRATFNPQRCPEDRYLDLEYCRKDGTYPEWRIDDKQRTTITRTWPERKEELASLFKSARSLVTYDDFTAVIDEARLCGCPVTIVPSETFKGAGAYRSFMCGDAGISIHGTEFDARDRLAECEAHADKKESEYKDALRRFVAMTQERADAV